MNNSTSEELQTSKTVGADTHGHATPEVEVSLQSAHLHAKPSVSLSLGKISCSAQDASDASVAGAASAGCSSESVDESASNVAAPLENETATSETAEASDPELAEISAQDDGSVSLLAELEYVSPPQGGRTSETADPVVLHIQTVAEARAIVEAFLFATTEPLSIPRLSRLMNNLHPRCVRALVLELQMEYENRGGALQIVEVAGGYQFATRPQFGDWIFRMQRHRKRNSLSPATLETLAIIAYKQPVTRAEVEAIRGVDSSGPIHTLLELGLIEVGGRRDVIGRPQLFVTTNQFLKTFGLRSLGDLPSIHELKQMFEQESQRTNGTRRLDSESKEKASSRTQPHATTEDTNPLSPLPTAASETSDSVGNVPTPSSDDYASTEPPKQ